MKKYKYYIITTTVLLVLAIVLVLKDQKSTLKVGSKYFAIADTASISRIKINTQNQDLVLERSGKRWKINGSFVARDRSVKALLNQLSYIEVNAPVANSMKTEVLHGFASSKLTITVESSGRIEKCYSISENENLNVGSLALANGDNEPYIVSLPGFSGLITNLFPVNINFWRDKTLFSYAPAEIVSIKTSYPGKVEASFQYLFNGPDTLQIQSLSGKQTLSIQKDMARAYLMNFASISFESWAKQPSRQLFDSLTHQQPLCEISIKTTNNQTHTVKTYRIPNLANKNTFKLDKMYAVSQNDTVPVIVKYFDFNPIMKEFKDFLPR